MRAVFPILILLLFLAAPLPAIAAGEGADALHRINIAGRQRMLSQRIAMAACLVQTGADAEVNRNRVTAAQALFTETLNDLRHGNDGAGLGAETDATVLVRLDQVDRAWAEYSTIAHDALAGDAGSAAALTRLHAMAGKLLKLTDAVVTELEAIHGDGLVAPELVAAVNIAGRQRMLIQKTMMEACFAARNGNMPALTKRVLAAKSLFEHSLANLLIGQEQQDIIPAPTDEIEAQLVRVIRVWRWLGADLEALAEGGGMSSDHLAMLARAAEVVLTTMNETVSLYEAL